MNATDLVDRAHLRTDIPASGPGHAEGARARGRGTRERVQVFQGVVIRIKAVGSAETFTVARSASASAWSARSPCTRRSSPRSRSSPAVTYAGRSCTTCATGREGREGQGEARLIAGPSASCIGATGSSEDLERYETEIELQLYREYRDVLPISSTSWRPNAASTWQRGEGGGQGRRWHVYFEIELRDAWVWDMYRPARSVANVRVLTFRDVNVEELAGKSSEPPARRASVGARG